MAKVLPIIGMGRSGTSLLCQILENKGVYLGKENELIGQTPINIPGQKEHIEIQRIHNELLKDVFGITTWLFLIVGEEEADWEKSEYIIPYKNRLKEQVLKLVTNAKEINKNIVCFKDARTTMLLPMWVDIFAELEIDYNFILCKRHPEAVYQSLIRCSEVYNVLPAPEEITPRKRMYGIWAQYLAHAYNYKEKIALEIDYEGWFDPIVRNRQNLKLSEKFNLPWNPEDLDYIIQERERHF